MPSLQDLGSRLTRCIALGALAGIFAIAALGFGTAALYQALLTEVSPAAALAIVAGILAVLATIAGLAARGRRAPRHKRLADPASAVPEVADMVRRSIAANPGAAVLGAIAAGFILQSRPGLNVGQLTRLFSQIRR